MKYSSIVAYILFAVATLFAASRHFKVKQPTAEPFVDNTYSLHDSLIDLGYYDGKPIRLVPYPEFDDKADDSILFYSRMYNDTFYIATDSLTLDKITNR